jgi:hypothetical protein
MVTLLGFMWIVGNIFIIQIFVPDMVGPVSSCSCSLLGDLLEVAS